MTKIQKHSNVKVLVFLLIVLSFIQCRNEDQRGWSYYLDAPPSPEIVSMTSSIKNCVPPYLVTFYQETNHLIGTVEYLWDFGDGNLSTEQNPTHIYNSTGVYEVKLTVSNEIGEDVQYLAMEDLALPSIPVKAEFGYEHYNSNNFAPAKVLFSNSSSGSNIFAWNFGDGNQDNDDNPEHVFQNPGTYTVKLKGTCTTGDFDEYTQQIFVNPPPTRIFLDSLNLMLPKSFRNKSLRIDMFHNNTYVGSTNTISTNSYPFKFRDPEDFFESAIFQQVSYAFNEVFKFLVVQEISGSPDAVLFEIVLVPADIQNRHYPTNYYGVETVPVIKDVFMDLYFNY